MAAVEILTPFGDAMRSEDGDVVMIEASSKEKKKKKKKRKNVITKEAVAGPARQFRADTDLDEGKARPVEKRRKTTHGHEQSDSEPHKIDEASDETLLLTRVNLPPVGLQIDENVLGTESGASIAELTRDFKEIPQTEIDLVNEMFFNVPVINIVYELAMNTLLSGGVNISLSFRDFGEEETRYNNTVWSAFARNLVASMWMYGFAAVTAERHDDGLNFPRVLDLTQLKVFIRPNVYGCARFAFFTRQNTYGAPTSLGFGTYAGEGSVQLGGRQGDKFDPDKPLTGIHVFRESEPRPNGLLTSRVRKCVDPYERLRYVEHVYEVAMRRMANPEIVTARPEERASAAGDFMGARAMRANLRTGQNAERLDPGVAMQRAVAMAAAQFANANPGAPGSRTAPSVIKVEEVRTTADASMPGVPHLQLPVGRQMQQQRPPIAPEILEHRAYLEETISMIFQVPRAVFSATGVGIRSTGAQATAQEVWEYGQRALRQRVLAILYNVYRLMHSQENIREAITRAPELSSNRDAMVKAAAPRITIASIPTYERMRDLLEIGALREEAFFEYVHVSEGLPRSYLETTLLPKLLEPYIEDTIPITESDSSSSSKSTQRSQKVLQRASKGKPSGGGSSKSLASKSKSIGSALRLKAASYHD